jgi:hypothetical protein
VDEELHEMLVETSSNDKKQRARDEVRWALMLDKTDKKLELRGQRPKPPRSKPMSP